MKFFDSMTMAELLTTLAAWVGLLLSLVGTWWNWHLTRTRLFLIACLVQDKPDGGKHLYLQTWDRRFPQAPPPTLQFGIKIVNHSQFPVYIESCGFCQNKQLDGVRLAEEEPVLISAATEGKSFLRNGALFLPFPLQPREAVVLQIRKVEVEKKALQSVLNDGLLRIYVKTADDVIKTRSVREFLRKLLAET